MHRIGLALSGGGFRATLFHLGMIRFLREANILPAVTHITSVSGGSILAAHLVLNWHRYTDSLKEFDAAAAELIRFVQLDIRNRIVRRYPLTMPLRVLRRLSMLRRPYRQMTLTGLLEYHYEKFLYGDTCLFQLPQRPRLFILATNLSEGCLCAFSRDGLLMQRRRAGQRFHFDRIHTGLATVPMAVAASSAFPGLFPPLELQGQDVGADPGQFGRIAFTDGGVYDNLGVRMFRCLERSWMAREVRLQRDDLVNADEVVCAIQSAAEGSEDNPLRRLALMLAEPHNGTGQPVPPGDEAGARLLHGLWHVMNHENLARHRAFASLNPHDPEVASLLEAAQRPGSEIEAGEQLWLNRQLVDAAYRKATGKPCFRSLNVCFDAVLVSDAGKQFKISSNTHAGGLISTAMRATDIAMDRVWQLEIDTFAGTPGFVFAPISKVVEPEEDPTAQHPEVQRMSADIRTDLDRFSPLEISSLIRHGYCIGRSACRSRPDLFGASIPADPPWNPLASGARESTSPIPTEPSPTSIPALPPSEKPVPDPVVETVESRKLQQSGGRRLWSTLLDYRDWTSFVYVPLLVPILILLPYYGVKWYHRAQVTQHLVEGLAQSNQDYAVMSKLLQDGPSPGFAGVAVEEVQELGAPNYSGFEIIADTRILDFRPWKASVSAERSWAYLHRRLRVKKLEASANRFVIYSRSPTTRLDVRGLNNRVPITVRLQRNTTSRDDLRIHQYEVTFDLTTIPVRDVVDLQYEVLLREPRPEVLQSTSFSVDADTGLLSYWVLLPEGKQHQSFELLCYPIEKTAAPEHIAPANLVNVADGKLLAFSLLSVKPGFRYECRWVHRE